jgi:WD40 repeat protein
LVQSVRCRRLGIPRTAYLRSSPQLPDGSLYVTRGDSFNGEILHWQTDCLVVCQPLVSHQFRVTATAFSPSPPQPGQPLLLAFTAVDATRFSAETETLSVINVESREVIFTQESDVSAISLSFSPYRPGYPLLLMTVVSGLRDSVVNVTNLNTNEVSTIPLPTKERISQAVFGPARENRPLLAVLCSGKLGLWVWDVDNNCVHGEHFPSALSEEVPSFGPVQAGFPLLLAFSTTDVAVKVIDVDSCKLYCDPMVQRQVTAVQFQPARPGEPVVLLGGDNHGTIRKWNMEMRRQTVVGKANGHTGGVTGLSFSFASAVPLLATCGARMACACGTCNKGTTLFHRMQAQG